MDALSVCVQQLRDTLVMMYCPSRFVFIHIPRTGGRSITQAVASCIAQLGDVSIAECGLDGAWRGLWAHTRAEEVLQAGVVRWEACWRFAVIRSPWEIAASLYRLARAQPPRRPMTAFDHYICVSHQLAFAEWIEWHLGELLRGGFWRHWCCDPSGQDPGVEAVRYEQLATCWPDLAARLGVAGVALPHVNGAAGQVEWTPAAVELVAKLCHDDIARFGYQPPALCLQPSGPRH